MEKDLGNADHTHTALQDDLISPVFIDEYRNESSKKWLMLHIWFK